jgi:hypothetical protein
MEVKRKICSLPPGIAKTLPTVIGAALVQALRGEEGEGAARKSGHQAQAAVFMWCIGLQHT